MNGITASALSGTALLDQVGVTVLKKAMDIQAQAAVDLIATLPAASVSHLPPHLGQNINITA